MALPFLLFIVLNVVNPHYMSPLYTTAMGRVLLAAGAALLAVGAWVMNRLAVIRY
jgi:Flp pilus assembly protein TadB